MTQTQAKIIAAYEKSGRTVHITRKRDGRVLVSLSGFRPIPVAEAIAKIAQVSQ